MVGGAQGGTTLRMGMIEARRVYCGGRGQWVQEGVRWRAAYDSFSPWARSRSEAFCRAR